MPIRPMLLAGCDWEDGIVNFNRCMFRAVGRGGKSGVCMADKGEGNWVGLLGSIGLGVDVIDRFFFRFHHNTNAGQ